MNTSLTFNCSFFGHRQVENKIKTELLVEEVVVNLITKCNVTVFYFGGFGEFDELCFSIVNKLKNNYANITTTFCYSNDKELHKIKRKHILTSKHYDNYLLLPTKNNYWYYRILLRNYEIIKASDYIVFYVNEELEGGALSAYKYAKKLHKPIVNVI